MITLHIVDDHSLIRDGIRSLLHGDNSFQVVAESATCAEAALNLQRTPAHVLLLDIVLPDKDGISFTREVRQQYPHMAILAVSMHSELNKVLGMIDAGANGFLLKSTNAHELKQAITAVAEGRTYIAGAFAQQFVQHYYNQYHHNNNTSAPHRHTPQSIHNELLRSHVQRNPVFNGPQPDFSPREVEILQMLANEYTSQEIADALNLSLRTIDNYRRKLMNKTGARNGIGLVKYALRHGFVKAEAAV